MIGHFILFPVISNHRADSKDNTIALIYCNDSFIDFGLTIIGKSFRFTEFRFVFVKMTTVNVLLLAKLQKTIHIEP